MQTSHRQEPQTVQGIERRDSTAVSITSLLGWLWSESRQPFLIPRLSTETHIVDHTNSHCIILQEAAAALDIPERGRVGFISSRGRGNACQREALRNAKQRRPGRRMREGTRLTPARA
ncbi:hypothetical protein NW759_002381 [Fusarium solani]|nr:hypothetical protein NW759_002381 [Fusarium solani]